MAEFTEEQKTLIKNYIDTTINSNQKKLFAVIGDSGSSQEPIDAPAWPSLMNQLFNAYGMHDYEVVSFAFGGSSFSTLQQAREFNQFTKTQIDRVVEINPLVVIVMLGANDFIFGNRTQAQVFPIVTSVFQEIKVRLPDTKILYLHQHFYDASNFTPGNLKNKGVIPYLFNLKSSGYLANTYNTDGLDDAVSQRTRAFCVNMDALKRHIQTLATVDVVESLDLFRVGRLGGVVSDGIHTNYFGRGLLCMMIAFILKNYFPEMMYRGLFSKRQDIDTLFNTLLSRSGNGYLQSNDDTERYDLQTASLYNIDLTYWFLPRKINLTFTERLPLESGVFLAQLMDAYPNTDVEQSINEAAFGVVGKTNEMGNAFVELTLFKLQPTPSKGIYRIRWKIGNCVLGPYPITIV